MSCSKILLIGSPSLLFSVRSHERIAHLDVLLLWYVRFHLVELSHDRLDRASLARQWYEINNSTVVVADCRKFPFQPHRAVFDSALNFSMTKLAPPGTLIDVPPSLSTQALLFPMRLGVPAHCGAARGLSRFRDASIHGYCALRSGDVISRNVR